MSNNEVVLAKFKELKTLYETSTFVKDKSGVKLVELIDTTMKLNPTQPFLDLGFKSSSVQYIKKELKWYLSQSLSIHPFMDDVKIWTEVCDHQGIINSNYGWCIFSEENFSQYNYALNELINNESSRRACMMYNRPSMTKDYNLNGRSDYMCTIYTQSFIRDNKLIYNIKQRSVDAIFGFFNDFAWHCYVYTRLLTDLRSTYPNLCMGIINYNMDSLHVYERHFKLFDKF